MAAQRTRKRTTKVRPSTVVTSKSSSQPVKPARKVTYWQRLKTWARRSRLAHAALLALLAYLILLAFFFSEVLKPGNYVEVFPREFVLPFAMHALTALIIATVVYLLPRPRTLGPKAVAALVVALSMVNYDARLTAVAPVMQAFLPILPSNAMPLLSLLLIAILFAIGVGAGVLIEKMQTKYPSVTGANVLGMACIVVAFIFAGQAWPVARLSSDIRAAAAYVPTAELEQAGAMHPATDIAEKPDIYYIVMDRYTNNEVYKTQFGYDNTPFLDGLRSQGFNVDDNSFAAYPYTAPSIASTLNMSYHNDDLQQFKHRNVQSGVFFHTMTEQSQVVKLLQRHGYQYHSVGSTYGTSYRAPLAARDYACNKRLEIGPRAKCLHGLEISQFERSPFYRFANVPVTGWPVHYQEKGEVDYVREQLTHLFDLANDPQQGGKFVFAHLLVPHDPFLFNADGSLAAYRDTDNMGRPIKHKFTDQVQFINDQMKALVAAITRNSGDKAVIMLISDEGPYPPTMNQTFLEPTTWEGISEIIASSNMTEWPDSDLAMKFGTLQAVRIPQATEEDMAHISPVNAFRIVLNRYFGYSYPYLPECQLGLPDGRTKAYHFTDITARLSGVANADCKQFE